MSQKKHKPEGIVAKLRQSDAVVAGTGGCGGDPFDQRHFPSGKVAGTRSGEVPRVPAGSARPGAVPVGWFGDSWAFFAPTVSLWPSERALITFHLFQERCRR